MAKRVQFDTMFIGRFITGLWTNRSPLAAELAGVIRSDALIDGKNIEISNQGTLKRRPGNTKYSTVQLAASEIPRTFYLFHDDDTFRIMVDTGLKVSEFSPSARTDRHTLVNATFPVSLLYVLNTLYFSNGGATNEDQKKLIGTTVSKWGIDAPSAAPTVSTADAAAAFTIDAAPTGASRTSNISTFTTTAAHGFTVDQKVTVAGVTDTTFNGTYRILTVPTTTTFTVSNSGTNGTSGGGTVVETSISVEAEVRYRFVFRNNSTGHISNASPRSADSTGAALGPFSSKVVTITGARSTDTQVDKIEIYRTADGGSTYFHLATLANPGSGTWTYKDGVIDEQLGTREAPIELENTPPPIGLKNLKFSIGRVWGSVDNIVYYGGGGDILNGVPEECFPPLNTFRFPDHVTAMVPFSLGILVFTHSEVYAIRGGDKFSLFPQLIDRIGVTDENKISSDGDFLYAFTSDGQLVRVGPLGLEAAIGRVEELGFPIGNLLQPLTSVYVAVHHYGSNDNALYVSGDDAGTSKLFRYNLSTESWSPRYEIVNGIRAIKSIQVSAGVYRLLSGRSTDAGYILKRDDSVVTDDGTSYAPFVTLGSLVLTKPGELTEIESLILERLTAGADPTVAVLGNEFGHTGFAGTFVTLATGVADPPEFAASTTLTSKRYYLNQAAASNLMRHMQIKLTFATAATADEVLALSIMGART